MNKKGFTIIELLAIIVILVIISLFSIPSIINITKNTESNPDVYETIYMATETYIYNNYDNFRELDNADSTTLVSVIDLINNDYLKSTLKNPKDNETFTSNDYILVTRNKNMTLSFDIVNNQNDSFNTIVLKLNKKDNYINGKDEFVTVVFDKDGGNIICENQFGTLADLTYNSLAIGKNNITCVAKANNGTTTTLIESITLNGYFDYNTLSVTDGAYVLNNNIIIPYNGIQYGPYYKAIKGCYMVEITGTNLTQDDYIASYEKSLEQLNTLSLNITSNKIVYYVNLSDDMKTYGIELQYRNMVENTTKTINNIKVTPIDSCPTS